MAKLSRRKLWERLEAEWVTNCIECGCCQFILSGGYSAAGLYPDGKTGGRACPVPAPPPMQLRK